MAQYRSQLKIEDEKDKEQKSVKQLIPMDLYFADRITDGNGDVSNRILLRIRGTRQFYFLFAKGVEENMKKPAAWLQKELEHMVGDTEEAQPEDMEAPKGVPIGSPL